MVLDTQLRQMLVSRPCHSSPVLILPYRVWYALCLNSTVQTPNVKAVHALPSSLDDTPGAHWRADYMSLGGSCTLNTWTLGLVAPNGLCRIRRFTFHDGSIGTVSPPTQLHSVTIIIINLASERLRSFSILTFDADAITVLWLGTSKARALSATIPHISLSALRQLGVCIEHINPAALGQFFMNHFTLEELDYCGATGAHNPPAHTEILADPPVAHPRLTTIRTRNRAMGGALAVLHTSPNLHTFSFLFPIGPPPARLAGLILDLRQIFLRANDKLLCLRLSQSHENAGYF
ncbi:hypothetical protein B0H19DRAFT_528407 [Mycena capillaripes]|nr:hypothetical protein B0H19DRAFT_528407 [Mycena capillaripes]